MRGRRPDRPIDHYLVHPEPIWRDRANFIVAAIWEENDEVLHEQLWTEQVAENLYVVFCIPLFCYRLALGEVVSTDEEHVLTRLWRALDAGS